MVDLRDGDHCECCRASRKSFALEQVGKPSGKEKTKKTLGGVVFIRSQTMYILSRDESREEMRRDEKSEDDHQANAERKEFCLRTSRRDMKHGSQVDIQAACNL